MPTASTAQIFGNNESFEPFNANIFIRRVLSGEFICVNKYLIKDLIELDLWTSTIKNLLINNNGSIQDIKNIPKYLRDIYKTVWEIRQKNVIDMAVSRSPYIDQSQSLNIHID